MDQCSFKKYSCMFFFMAFMYVFAQGSTCHNSEHDELAHQEVGELSNISPSAINQSVSTRWIWQHLSKYYAFVIIHPQ